MPHQLKSLALGLTALSTLAVGSAVPQTSVLRKRYDTTHTLSSLSCGGFSSADTVDSGKNTDNLNNGDEKAVAAGTCNRVGCYNTSGVYVCNDNDYDITVTNADASAFAGLIWTTCAGDVGEGHHPTNGQAFTGDQGGYNVVVAYCNGNDDPSVPPTGYTPPGPNGYAISCGGNDQDACDLGTCSSDSDIVVDSQENTPCDTYLGANTVGPNATYTYSTTRLVSTTWQVGFDLGIDSGDLASASGSAGFSFSYSQTTTTGSSSGISQACGPLTGSATGSLFSCDMEIQPGCFHITGTCLSSRGSSWNIRVPFDTTQPQTDENGLGVYAPAICTCHNCCDWANPDAPALACFEDCPTCEPLPGDGTCPS